MISGFRGQNGGPLEVKRGITRREFIERAGSLLLGGGLALWGGATLIPKIAHSAIKKPVYDPKKYSYAYTIEIPLCIGCGMCAKACKVENKVPDHYFRTWVERYSFLKRGDAVVDSPKGGVEGFAPRFKEEELDKAFFVPKLCNHYRHPRCVQVCPVGASFITEEGVVLIDKRHCVGCAYCVQACPYGARYLHPVEKVADKCTWCYHRITKGTPLHASFPAHAGQGNLAISVTQRARYTQSSDATE